MLNSQYDVGVIGWISHWRQLMLQQGGVKIWYEFQINLDRYLMGALFIQADKFWKTGVLVRFTSEKEREITLRLTSESERRSLIQVKSPLLYVLS